MQDYTIYCTEEQTKKALELGASISNAVGMTDIVKEKYFADGKGNFIILPTAEQMIGWLEERGFIIEVSFRGTDEPNKQGNKVFIYHLFDYSEWEELNPLSNMYKSRKEATLAAIDAALEYLINKKK